MKLIFVVVISSSSSGDVCPASNIMKISLSTIFCLNQMFDQFWFYIKICKQIAVYLTFAANTASFEAALLALTGSEALQWMKVCNKFTRFCVQMGGALLCGYVASILMALISTTSAYRVFRMYSPKWFLRLKSK